MNRFQVGPLLRGDAVMVVDAEPAAMSWPDRPLFPERCPWLNYDDHVPAQLSTADTAVAAWVADNTTLREPARAFAVLLRAPDVDSFPARGAPFDADAGRAAIRDLREGKAVQTSVVVRVACHVLETT